MIKKLEELADTTSFEEDKKLYEAAASLLREFSWFSVGKHVPEWIYKQLDSLIKRDMKRSEAHESVGLIS